MKDFYQDDVVTLLHGDVMEVLQTLPSESVHCVVTSPPFWNQRNYRVEGQIGLEPSLEEYIAKLVDVFREVRRVLRSDGVAWVELGDSYIGSGGPGGDFRDGKGGDSYGRQYERQGSALKPLDLANVPFRLALALQADGWYHRSTLIWSRPNPMPESVHGTAWVRHRIKVASAPRESPKSGNRKVLEEGGGYMRTDGSQAEAKWESCPGCPKCAPNDGWVLRRGAWRPTDQHSYILMLTKTADYFCDQEAVRESPAQSTETRVLLAASRQRENQDRRNGTVQADSYKRSSEARVSRDTFADPRDHLVVPPPPGGRNMRTVMNLPTEPLAYAHYASFPQALVEPFILAATSLKGCCPECGKQWARMIEHTNMVMARSNYREVSGNSGASSGTMLAEAETQTLGWKATCSHGLEPVPCTVLDPFVGSGTTCIVARRYGRRSIGIDLSADYLGIAVKRLAEVKKAQRRMAW